MVKKMHRTLEKSNLSLHSSCYAESCNEYARPIFAHCASRQHTVWLDQTKIWTSDPRSKSQKHYHSTATALETSCAKFEL